MRIAKGLRKGDCKRGKTQGNKVEHRFTFSARCLQKIRNRSSGNDSAEERFFYCIINLFHNKDDHILLSYASIIFLTICPPTEPA